MVPLVLPTLTDPVVRSASTAIGGPWGSRAWPGPNAVRALRVVLLVGGLTFSIGMLRTVPCAVAGWAEPLRTYLLCYSDLPVLYRTRALWDGSIPYLSQNAERPLEYPVLTGLFAWLSAKAADGPVSFYWVSAVMLMACFLVALAATAITVPHRVWDGMLVALAPSVIFASLINWDWLAVALTAACLLAWSRSRPVAAGLLLGLGAAAKFYPLLLLGPLFLLCWRRSRLPDFWRAAVAAAVAWLVVNLPFMLLAPRAWAHFFEFSRERGQDFGSVWLAASLLGRTVDPDRLNLAATGCLVLLCAGIAWLVRFAPRPPRLAAVAFLVVAAFLVTNKVYSPQFVLWLLPLAVLARPRWRDLLIWQGGEAVYFVAVWWYLRGLSGDHPGLDPQGYAWAILIHVAVTLWFAGLVVRDALQPARDPVRTDLPGDDPGGGVLDGAPDRCSSR